MVQSSRDWTFVFYNPHVDDFIAEPPHFHLLKRRALRKYGYLLDEVLRREGKADVYVDASASAFVPARAFLRLPAFVRQAIAAIEVGQWLAINGLQERVVVHTTPAVVSRRPLLIFSYKGASTGFEHRFTNLSAFPLVVAHLSHYAIGTRVKSANLRRLPNVVLAGDADLSANGYFRSFFSWYQRPVLLVPFAIGERFRVRRPFAERERRAVATGTFHDLRKEIPREPYADYMTFFQLDTYHPVRKLLHEASETIRNRVEVRTSLYRAEDKGGLKLVNALKHLSVSQKSYFAFDIVELYNSYRYAVVGEEMYGVPAVGAFEAMASGCVLIGEPQYYAGWPLTPGVHFVPHDGTLPSILAAIESLRRDEARAAAIAAAGTRFVEENCRSAATFDRVMNAVTRLSEDA